MNGSTAGHPWEGVAATFFLFFFFFFCCYFLAAKPVLVSLLSSPTLSQNMCVHTHTHTQNRELLCTLSGNVNGMAITEDDLEIPLSSYPEEMKSLYLGQYLQQCI